MNRVHSSAEGGASIPGELVARLEAASALTEAAKALAERAIHYVAPPPRNAANPMLDADREMERLARSVLAITDAPVSSFGDPISRQESDLLVRLRARQFSLVKSKATGEPVAPPLNPDGPEAAAVIERLARQIAILKATTAPEAGAVGTTEGREQKSPTTREGADR